MSFASELIPKEAITKLEAARRQLDAAITLFFQGGDPVSIHTLAAASSSLCGDLLAAQNREPWAERIRKGANATPKDFYATWRMGQNFFKHADKDHDGTIEFGEDDNEVLLLVAAMEYAELATATVEMKIFYMWYIASYPDGFVGGSDHLDREAALSISVFPNLRAVSRVGRIAEGALVLAKTKMRVQEQFFV